jgi:uncharacterized protein involved in exopolysaccharide biosynthesis
LQREAELQNLIGLSAEYYTLNGRVDRERETYNFMLDKRAEAQIKENQILELGSIQVITPARPASRPASVLNTRIVALGAIASAIAGVLLAFLLEYLSVSRILPQPRLPASESGQGTQADSGSLREPLKETG